MGGAPQMLGTLSFLIVFQAKQTDKECEVSCIYPAHLQLQKNRWFTPKPAASSCAKCTFNSMWHTKTEFFLQSAFAALQKKKKKTEKNHCHHAFIPLLSRVHPPAPAEITGVAFPALNESCDVEWDRKVEKKSEGIKNSWRGALVFAPLNLHTSCLRAGWSYHHTTLHKQTSCHPWHRHTIWCAITAGMFPELVFHVCVATWGTSAELIFMRARTFLLS